MKKFISFLLRRIPRKYLQLVSHIGLKVLVIFYKGKGVKCSVCEKEFKKFLPYGRLEPRENALCPNCLSLERHRLIWKFLNEKTDFFTANLKMLHVAPEHCFIKRFGALPNLEHITADIESPLAQVKMDVHDIPFPENTFDVLFCNHVLEHVTDDFKVMSEFQRVLKPGGWAILQSPQWYHLETTYEDPTITDPQEREKHFGQDDHLRIYGRDYGDRLRQGGFDVEDVDINASLTKEQIHYYGLPAQEVIYLCKKKAS